MKPLPEKNCPECNRPMQIFGSIGNLSPYWKCLYCNARWTPVKGIRGIDAISIQPEGKPNDEPKKIS